MRELHVSILVVGSPIRGKGLAFVLTLVFLYCDHLRNGSLKYSNVPAGTPDLSHGPGRSSAFFGMR